MNGRPVCCECPKADRVPLARPNVHRGRYYCDPCAESLARALASGAPALPDPPFTGVPDAVPPGVPLDLELSGAFTPAGDMPEGDGLHTEPPAPPPPE